MPGDRAQQVDVDLAPDDGGDLGHALVVAERVEAGRQEIADRPWDRGGGGDVVGARRLRDGLRQLLGEERVAVGAIGDHRPQVLGDAVDRRQLLHELAVIGRREPSDVDHLMVGRQPVDGEVGPRGRQDQERERGVERREPRDELERGLVGPLQVLDEQERRSARARPPRPPR